MKRIALAAVLASLTGCIQVEKAALIEGGGDVGDLGADAAASDDAPRADGLADDAPRADGLADGDSDSVPPAPPTLDATDPASPSSEPFPVLLGTAEPGATVLVFADATCDGLPVAEAQADDLGAFATDPVEVALNTATVFSARAVDGAGNASDCAEHALTYVNDTIPPDPPTIFAISPPSSNTSPVVTVHVRATPLAFDTVALFDNAGCEGPSVATLQAEDFGNAVFEHTVTEVATRFSALSLDAAGNASDCAAGEQVFVYDPTPPSFLGLTSVTPVAADAVALGFSPPSDNHYPVAQLVLDVCWAQNPTDCVDTFEAMATFPADAADPVVSGLAPNQAHHFIARARDPLGNRDANVKSVSTITPTDRASVAAAAGEAHACALLSDRTVACWGANDAGQLGDGTVQGAAAPVRVSGLEGVRAITAGAGHTCAARWDGTVACWGSNDLKQLGGNELDAYKPLPTTVAYLDAVVDLAAGRNHTCAANAQGAVLCWGDNTFGQLGTAAGAPKGIPEQALAPHLGAQAVASGDAFSCALDASGLVRCWGKNDLGQLARGVTDDLPSLPGPITDLPVARRIAAGADHACALDPSGQLYCWGSNTSGQLGISTSVTKYAVSPLAHPTLKGLRDLALGDGFTCVLEADGDVQCWGRNDKGQLGTGTVGAGSVNPVKVETLGRTRALAAGSDHVCATSADGRTTCWGAVPSPESPVADTPPTQVPSLFAPSRLLSVSTGRDATCGVTVEGKVRCWGRVLGAASDAEVATTPQPVAGLEGVLDVRVGGRHACALRADGELLCWGNNDKGQLGRGPVAGGPIPGLVDPFGSKILSFGVGEHHTCAITEHDQLYCWGDNSANQLAMKTTASVVQWPLQADLAPAGLLAVAGGTAHTCVHRAEGTVRCWGANDVNQLGTPVVTQADTGHPEVVQVVQLEVGAHFGCVRRVGGTVQCWGANDQLQLGTASVSEDGSEQPITVVQTGTAVHLSLGHQHACVTGHDGQARCWGANQQGQLGRGAVVPPKAAAPAPAQLGLDVASVAAGSQHGCAQRRDGQLICWGANGFGQVGVGHQVSPLLLPSFVLEAR